MLKNRIQKWWLAVLAAALVVVAVVESGIATETNLLVLISKSGTNMSITLSNGLPTSSYELYHVPVLADTAYPWTLISVGTTGQTNWLVDT